MWPSRGSRIQLRITSLNNDLFPDPPKKGSEVNDKYDGVLKSEGEDEAASSGSKHKATLGRTPNHLTLRYDPSQLSSLTRLTNTIFSTTSTLSAGSTGSQARLIQSSHQPENYHPIQVEELGKQNTRIVKVDVHTKSKSPNRSPKNHSPVRSRKTSPNAKRSASTSPNAKRSGSTSPRASVKSTESPKGERRPRSPKKIKSSLKQPSRSLSIENPTCVECYLSAKGEKG